MRRTFVSRVTAWAFGLVMTGTGALVSAAVLTIDDADRSVYELAWPLLRKYGMRAHLFVPTAKVGTSWSELEVCT